MKFHDFLRFYRSYLAFFHEISFEFSLIYLIFYEKKLKNFPLKKYKIFMDFFKFIIFHKFC